MAPAFRLRSSRSRAQESICRPAKSVAVKVGSIVKRRMKMHKIVDRVMMLAKPTSLLSQSELRAKVIGYVELISSTGKRDPDELAALSAEYLRKIVDGPDTRFTGC